MYARRGGDEHQRGEPRRLPLRCEHRDHRAHRVSDQNDVFEPQLVADLEHVARVALTRAVFVAIVRHRVGAARADVVEEHDSMRVLEGRRHVAPHVLVAAKAMRKQYGPRATP